jgi:hypothetical protein
MYKKYLSNVYKICIKSVYKIFIKYVLYMHQICMYTKYLPTYKICTKYVCIKFVHQIHMYVHKICIKYVGR